MSFTFLIIIFSIQFRHRHGFSMKMSLRHLLASAFNWFCSCAFQQVTCCCCPPGQVAQVIQLFYSRTRWHHINQTENYFAVLKFFKNKLSMDLIWVNFFLNNNTLRNSCPENVCTIIDKKVIAK